MSDPTSVLVGFGRRLRARGLPVGVGRIVTYCRAAAALAPLDRDSLYWAGRAALTARPEDAEVYDDEFHRYFSTARLDEVLRRLFEHVPQTRVPPVDDAGDVAADWALPTEEETEGESEVALIASRVEALRRRSFQDMDEDERRLADRVIRRLAVGIPVRTTRRLKPAGRGRFDLRRTMRTSMRTQGEPLRRAWRARSVVMRPLVLILDVSGSMSPYARALMQFGYATRRAGRRVEVFCFGTRLTRVTAALSHTDPDAALRDASERVHDWSGGTRIGDSLRLLLTRYSQTAALRGAVVVICSDGLDRGDPAMLSAQMARIARLAHNVIWVNPLKGDPRYEPLARGMAAALPHVDTFLAGHNLASLEGLAEAVAR